MDINRPGSRNKVIVESSAIRALMDGEDNNHDYVVIIRQQVIAAFVVPVLVRLEWLLLSPTSFKSIQHVVQISFKLWMVLQDMAPSLFGDVYLVAVPVSYHPLSPRIGQGAHSFSRTSARCGIFNHTSKLSFCQKDDTRLVNELEISHDYHETH